MGGAFAQLTFNPAEKQRVTLQSSVPLLNQNFPKLLLLLQTFLLFLHSNHNKTDDLSPSTPIKVEEVILFIGTTLLGRWRDEPEPRQKIVIRSGQSSLTNHFLEVFFKLSQVFCPPMKLFFKQNLLGRFGG